MKRKFGIGITVVVLVFTLLSPGLALADEMDDTKESIKERDKEIQRIEKEKKQTEKDRGGIFSELEEKKKELNRLSQDVYDTEQQLNKSKKRLKKKEEQIDEQKSLLKHRIRTLYRQGDNFYLESLLEAKSFNDFFQRLEFVRLISQRDRSLLEGLEEDHQSLSAEKTRKEELLKKLKKKSKEARSLHAELTAEYNKYNSELEDLAKEQKHLEEINEQEKKKIRDMIRKRSRPANSGTYAGTPSPSSSRSEGKPVQSGGAFYWPVDGAKLTSPYGMRYHPVRKQYRMHTGFDLAGPLGKPIKAAENGKVIESRPAGGYGYIIVIDHGGGISTLYAHMYAQDVKVRAGQRVSKGQVIAGIGNNGFSTGPHAHIEVLKNGNHTNPMPYFKK